MCLQQMVDISPGMASALAGVALTALHDRDKFVRMLVVPQIDPAVVGCTADAGGLK